MFVPGTVIGTACSTRVRTEGLTREAGSGEPPPMSFVICVKSAMIAPADAMANELRMRADTCATAPVESIPGIQTHFLSCCRQVVLAWKGVMIIPVMTPFGLWAMLPGVSVQTKS